MDDNRENYRQRMIGQLQLWDEQLATIKDSIGRLKPEHQLDAIRRYQELESYHRDVFGKFEDLLLSAQDDWASRRQTLDESASMLQFVLDTYNFQPA